MKNSGIPSSVVIAGICVAATNLCAEEVPLGTWLQEGTGTVTGSGSSFTATPTPSGIPDTGDNFGERNAARQRVYQLFDQPIDFSSAGQTIVVNFDVVFSGTPKLLDSDFRMSLVDTSTNQGFYAVGFDIGGRAGSYNRARFVDNLDGEDFGSPHAGGFNDAINGSGTVGSSGTPPTITNGATELGLVDGNKVSFSVVFTRNAGNSFSFETNIWESNGDVYYEESAGSYDPVNPTSGDTEVSHTAINSFDGIVFGIFDDDPFVSTGSYTVSNLAIRAVSDISELADIAPPGIELDENGNPMINFDRSGAFLPGTVHTVERSTTLQEGSFETIYQFDYIKGAGTFLDTGILEDVISDQISITDTGSSGKGFYRVGTTLPD